MGLEEVKRGEKRVKMMVHVWLHTWKAEDDELRFESKDGDEYERLFLKPLREAEMLGVEWNEEQVLFEPIKGEKITGRHEKVIQPALGTTRCFTRPLLSFMMMTTSDLPRVLDDSMMLMDMMILQGLWKKKKKKNGPSPFVGPKSLAYPLCLATTSSNQRLAEVAIG